MAKFDREYDKWQSTQEKISQGSPRYKPKRHVDVFMSAIAAMRSGEPKRNHTMKSTEPKVGGRESKRARVRLMKQERADREENQRRLDADENYGSW